MSLVANWLSRADHTHPAVGDETELLDFGALRARVETTANWITENYAAQFLLIPSMRKVEFVIQLLACMVAGRTAVPIDPQTPEKLMKKMGVTLGDWACLETCSAALPPQALNAIPSPMKYPLVLFTSGTSGNPKAVPISDANIDHSTTVISKYLAYSQRNSAAIVLPLHYSYALLSQLMCMISVGGYSHIFENLRNPLKIASRIEALGLKTFCGVPSTFQSYAMLKRMSPDFAFPGVEVVCSAGAAFDHNRLTELKSLFPRARVFNNYGMTEATPRITFIEDSDPKFLSGSCGQAIDGLEIKIIDEDGQEVGLTGSGVVHIKGPNVVDCYLNDPQATDAAFGTDGYLSSGDIGFMDAENYLFLIGRVDEVFNVGGEKVSPFEIESCLLNDPVVDACAIFPFEDERRGRLPFAYVVISEKTTKKALNLRLKTELPPTKLPWRYYAVSHLPMTSSGKLKRNALSPDATCVIEEIH